MKKKTTIKDIAEVLRISPSTVSKALNDHPRISKKTKKKVIQVSKELDYQPNFLASALRKGKSKLVGVMIPRNNSSFFSSVLQSIDQTLSDRGYNVIIAQSYESNEKETKNIEGLLQIRVEGILASMANETTDLEPFANIIKKGVPLILFDRIEDDLDVDFVGIDDRKSSHLVIRHLVEQGYRRIAYLGGFNHTKIYRDRWLGYKEALINHGLEIDEQLISQGKLTLEEGRHITTRLLALNNPPDAIYAAGDYAALGALQVLKERGIQIPDQMAVAGCSNEPFTSLISPSITTIDQKTERIGSLAAGLFLDKVEKDQDNHMLNRILLEPELIVRESSNRLIKEANK